MPVGSSTCEMHQPIASLLLSLWMYTRRERSSGAVSTYCVVIALTTSKASASSLVQLKGGLLAAPCSLRTA